MQFVTSFELAQLLAPMLRLPDATTRFVIRAEAGKPAIVECEYVLTDPPNDDGEFRKQLSEYALVQTSAPKKFNFDVWVAERKEKAHRAYMESMKRMASIDRHIAMVKEFKSMSSWSPSPAAIH